MPIEQIFESYGNKLIAPAVSEGGGGEQAQSDWSQADASQPDYIKNKPTITTSVTSGSTALVTSGAVYSYVDTMITQALAASY